MKTLFKCITSNFCARRSFKRGNGLITNLPSPKMSIGPNSIGCQSLGNSRRVASSSRAVVKGPAHPTCAFKLGCNVGCGNFFLAVG